jgi:hypothetical protein
MAWGLGRFFFKSIKNLKPLRSKQHRIEALNTRNKKWHQNCLQLRMNDFFDMLHPFMLWSTPGQWEKEGQYVFFNF